MDFFCEQIPSYLRKLFCILLIASCCNAFGEESDVEAENSTVNDSYIPLGFTFHASYVSPKTAEVSLFDIRPFADGDAFHITEWLSLYFGFDPVHVSIGPSGISDETLLSIGAYVVAMPIFLLFEDSVAPDTIHREDGTSAKDVLAMIFLGIPLYLWCGNLYIPLVPKAWLGLTDQSHLLTYVLTEKGFYRRSFTYVNDVGLRFSPIRYGNGGYHVYLEGGVRFEKNFADDFKTRYYFQLGFSSTRGAK